MANAVYKEARGESIQGMIGVAYVIMNRLEHTKFPDTVCGVVYQPRQFPWATKKISISDQEAFEKSVTIAQQVMNKTVKDPTHGALYFSTSKITKTLTAKIGNHYFTK